MDTEQLEKELTAAEADLAFALAQGDGFAEDAADARIAVIKAQLREVEITDRIARARA
jgi:hypothetical protein